MPDHSAVVKTAKHLKRREQMLKTMKGAKPKAPRKTKKSKKEYDRAFSLLHFLAQYCQKFFFYFNHQSSILLTTFNRRAKRPTQLLKFSSAEILTVNQILPPEPVRTTTKKRLFNISLRRNKILTLHPLVLKTSPSTRPPIQTRSVPFTLYTHPAIPERCITSTTNNNTAEN